MNHENKYTDKKLQELENQSLPDLSKMDEHWQQMGLLLQPAMPASGIKKIGFGKKVLLVFFSAAIVTIISLFIYRNINYPTKSPAKEAPVANTTVTVDSPLLVRARTTEGRDTLLKVIPVNPVPTEKNNKLALEKFYEQLQKKPQAFIINTQRDTVIHGKEGTSLYIPANSFDVKESFTLLLTEFYSVKDMITQKLTTTCDGRQLVTGGMIYLDARDKNQELVYLKKGTALRLDITKQNTDAPMELFYGYDYYRNNVTEVMDSINWKRTNQVFTDAKANPATSFLLIDNSKVYDKRDTVRLMERGDLPITFDYAARDTLPRKTGITIKGDSVVLPKASIDIRQSILPNTKDTLRRKTGITIKGDSIILQRYGVNIQQLGWINCDRFYNDARPGTELIVDLGDNPDNYNTMLVFDNFASIMPPSARQGNTIRFLNLREGEPARIISVGIRNDKPVTAMRKLVISKTPVNDLNYEEISASAFRKKLGQ